MYCIAMNGMEFAKGIVTGLQAADPEVAERYRYFTMMDEDGIVYDMVCWDDSDLPRNLQRRVGIPMTNLLDSLQLKEIPYRLFRTEYELR